MIIYHSSTDQFKNTVDEGQIADIMYSRYKDYYGTAPTTSEYNSWQNSTQFVRDVIVSSNLDDNHIMLEYEMPHSQSRLDCMLFGTDKKNKPKIFLIELKQWTGVTPSNHKGNYVCTYIGGGQKEVPHPSEQVKGYHNYLENFVEYLHDGSKLDSCAYCHNFSKDNTSFLFDDSFSDLMDDFPLYTNDDKEFLSNLLKDKVGYGNGLEIFNRFIESKIFPSKKLLKNVSDMIEGEEVFSLLDEQIIAKSTII